MTRYASEQVRMKNVSTGHFPLWCWIVFGATALALLVLDLLLHRGSGSRKRAIIWSVIWVSAGLAFGGFVWMNFGSPAAQDYLAAYLIEESLSLDNLFVFLIIFQSLKIPANRQHEVLFWGILGAVIFRALFIFAGVRAIERWEWVSFIFGAVLLYAAFRAFRDDPAKRHENKLVAWLEQHLPVTQEPQGRKFIARQNGRRVATPLLIALIGIELSDIMFAIDSVPAVFSVSRTRFIIYSSNIFAILELRALYLVLAQTIARFKYLHYGLAGVLSFTGIKLIIERWVHIPSLLSIAVIGLIIGAAVWASLHAQSAQRTQSAPQHSP